MKNKKSNILVVDDNINNLQVIGNFLMSESISISVTDNGFDALKRAATGIYDLILLDITMPEINGYDVCIKLKENPETRNIPVIFITAKYDTDDIVKGLNLGAVDYITKPFAKEVLESRINLHLYNRHAMQTIKEQKEELENLNATKNILFSIISHDLNNSIHTIEGYAGFLGMKLQKCEDSEITIGISAINNGIENTSKLLKNLFDWAKLQSSNTEDYTNDFRLYHNVADNIAICMENIQKKKIVVSNLIDKELSIKNDSNYFSTLIRNLLQNAIKYTANNGKITITAENNDKYCTISIKDTGVGISPEKLKDIFKITKNKSTKGTNGENGSGLGLILCRDLAKKMGGRLYAMSEPNVGSTFSIDLPHQI